MNSYRINKSTLAVIPIENNKTKIYEIDDVIIVDRNSKKIIEDNCEYYGSSYEGRRKGTTELIGVTHKSPIMIEESNNLVFFPTCSPRLKECAWISLNNVDNYSKYDNNSIIRFCNNLTLELKVSNKIINNQILKATRLESVLRKRKEELKKK